MPVLIRRLPSMCDDAVGERINPVIAFVEAGDVVEFAAARCKESLFAFDGDFFQRFQAIADEAGADDIHPPRVRCAQFRQRLVRSGAKPSAIARVRLESELRDRKSVV